MATEPKLRAIAPWFGGKRAMARQIVAELGTHTQYLEPFCGGLAVLFSKPVALQETACDLHGDLTNLAWVLQDGRLAVELYERVARTLYAEALLHHAGRLLRQTPAPEQVDPERAYWFFVQSWMMRSGTAGTARQRGHGFAMYLRYNKDASGGSTPAGRWQSCLESIPAWHERLRNVVILRRDGLTIVERFVDAPSLVVYADPPYPPESRSGFFATGSHSRYEHEFRHDGDLFDGPDDHARLRDALARFTRARVVVSYYDCPRIRALYEGWTMVSCDRRKAIAYAHNGRAMSEQRAPELLIINGPSLTG